MTLPREWSRGPQWLSDSDRAAWEPVLQRAQDAWSEIELLSITERIRDSALVFLEADEVARACADCARVGLELSVLAATGTRFRAAAHRRGLAQEWHRAWADQDDERIGKLLGFPPCCREFFQREWTARGSFDVVPAMTTIDGPWVSNVLLRWLGVRLVPHLPCSGDCEPTAAMATAMLKAGRRNGADVGAIEALLRLPITHSTLNGLAIVETPHFRLMASADPVPEETKRARSGDDAESPWRDNGFSSLQAMEAAHAIVLEAIGDQRPASVLDLGCGDGTLLARIGAEFSVGVEVDQGRAVRGLERHPHISFARTSIEAWAIAQIPTEGPAFDLALIMPGRLLEMDSDAADVVRRFLRERARRVVAYSYNDVLGQFCALAGLERVGPGATGPLAAASDVRFVDTMTIELHGADSVVAKGQS